MFVSYAQNFEDVMLERVFHSQTTGFYVDVGAWDPNVHSVTKHFYQRGWCGINIEPARSYHQMLRKSRSRDVNLNVAIGVQPGTSDFVEVQRSGLSSLSDNGVISRASRRGLSTQHYQVSVLTLQSVFEKYCRDKLVSFLKIDVEGSEREVIQSLDWKAHRPVIVLVEAVEPETWLPAWASWEPDLVSAGYEFVWFDGLNRFYLRAESKALRNHFVVPPCLSDGFVVESTHAISMRLRTRIRLLSREFLPTGLHEWLDRVYHSL